MRTCGVMTSSQWRRHNGVIVLIHQNVIIISFKCRHGRQHHDVIKGDNSNTCPIALCIYYLHQHLRLHLHLTPEPILYILILDLYILLANPNQNIPYTQELTLKTLQLSNLSCIGRTTLPRTTSLWIWSVAVTSRKCTTDAQWNPPSLRCEPQGSRDRTNGSAASRLFLKFLQFDACHNKFSFLPWMCDREGVDVALSNRGGCFVNISVNQYRM